MTTEVAPAATPAEPAAAAAPSAPAQPSAGTPDQPFATGQPTAPETTPGQAPETQAPAEPTAAAPKPLDELSDDELAQHERVQGLIARREEAARRRSEQESITRTAQERRAWVASTEFVNDFEGEIRRAATTIDDAGNVQIDRNKVDTMFGAMLAAGADQAANAIGTVFAQEVGNDFVMTAEEKELMQAAQTEFMRDPTRNSAALARQWLRMRDRAVLEAKTADLRREIERDVRRDLRAQQEEQEAKAAREETRTQPQPTATSGTPPPSGWRSQRQIDAAHARGEISTDVYRGLRTDGTYTRLPLR